MTHTQTRSTVVIVDNVDPDNSVAALVACHSNLGLNVEAVIVTGRPAHPDREAAIQTFDAAFSGQVLRRNTRRLKGLLERLGWDIPVFEGLTPPRTIVPHRVHIDERQLDLYGDERSTFSDGTFTDALDFLSGLDGVLDFVIGGPLTEVNRIMREPRLVGRLGTLTCQLGLFGFGNVSTMAGDGLTFNSAADPNAVRETLTEWPGDLYMVPTDITKAHAVGFDTPEDLHSLGLTDELVRLYEVFWQEVLMPRNERIYPHDVHPVFLMAQLRHAKHYQLYSWENIRVKSVGQNGELDAIIGGTTGFYQRAVVTGVVADTFKELLSVAAH